MDHDYSLLTVKEIAEELRVSKMTIYRAIEVGQLEAIKIGRAFRVKRASYEAWISQNQ